MEKKDGDGGKYQFVLTWVIFSTLFLTFIILIAWSDDSGFSSSLMGFKVPKNAVPMVELQRKVPSFNSSISQNFSATHRKPTTNSADNKLEQGLAVARKAIRKAVAGSMNNKSTFSNISVYHNPDVFYQSYAEMEKRFKVYVYGEGEIPLVHDGPCKGLYTSEGRFINEMERGANRFRTKDPHLAHVYFLPFSVANLVAYLYRKGESMTPLQKFVKEYVRVISRKYPFWNQTSGADHFMVTCHDWGNAIPLETPFLSNTSILVQCNANFSDGFNPQKDVSLPEINLYDGTISPKLRSIPLANNSRPLLAFFSGNIIGPVRPILYQHWKGRDPAIFVHEYLPKGLDYNTFLLQSKFCLCPSGYEVASPRIVEAIYAECVPVILSEHYVLPFSDVLNWEAFSIKVEIVDIPRLKEVLMAVPEEKYSRLKDGLRVVRKHFVFNQPTQRFDMFHMILHSVWLRRLNFRLG